MTGRPSPEVLCRQVIAILDQDLPAVAIVHQLRGLFEIPEPDPRPVEKDDRAWPVLRAADPHPYDPRD